MAQSQRRADGFAPFDAGALPCPPYVDGLRSRNGSAAGVGRQGPQAAGITFPPALP